MGRRIVKELKEHIPFTGFGAVSGVILMVIVIVAELPLKACKGIFHIFHPLHILLSALVTTAMLIRHSGNRWGAWLIGYVGSVGICSISDIFFPYLGSVLIGAKIELHICFIEHWWIVPPSAVVGIMIGYLRPITKIPHTCHVLVSTWASSFVLTGFGVVNWFPLLPFVFLILFFSVWLPCCVSDIIFPLLFVRE